MPGALRIGDVSLKPWSRILGADLDQVLIAVVDLPYAVVRRHLTAGGTIPANAADRVEACAGTLLDPPTSRAH
jgi:hypothetical protein